MKDLDIIIPAYNAHNTIFKTLCSIVTQSYIDKCKITIINDGGKSHHSIIKQFKSMCDIREISYSKNCGPAYSRQYGLDNTNLPYIMFVDADDLLGDTHSVEILMLTLKDENPSFVAGVFIEEGLPTAENDHPIVIHDQDATWLHGKIYRRDLINKHNLRFNTNLWYNEDSTFNNMYITLFHEPKYIDRVCYYWNYTKGSITKTNDFILNGFQGLCEGMVYAINFLTPLWNRGIVEDIRFLYLISNFIMFSYVSYNNFARSGRSEEDLNKFLGWYREACKTTFFPYEDKITLELYDLWLENNEKDRAKPQYNLPVISFEDYIELLRT